MTQFFGSAEPFFRTTGYLESEACEASSSSGPFRPQCTGVSTGRQKVLLGAPGSDTLAAAVFNTVARPFTHGTYTCVNPEHGSPKPRCARVYTSKWVSGCGEGLLQRPTGSSGPLHGLTVRSPRATPTGSSSGLVVILRH